MLLSFQWRLETWRIKRQEKHIMEKLSGNHLDNMWSSQASHLFIMPEYQRWSLSSVQPWKPSLSPDESRLSSETALNNRAIAETKCNYPTFELNRNLHKAFMLLFKKAWWIFRQLDYCLFIHSSASFCFHPFIFTFLLSFWMYAWLCVFVQSLFSP